MASSCKVSGLWIAPDLDEQKGWEITEMWPSLVGPGTCQGDGVEGGSDEEGVAVMHQRGK